MTWIVDSVRTAHGSIAREKLYRAALSVRAEIFGV